MVVNLPRHGILTYLPCVTDVRHYTRSIFIFDVVFASRRLCDSVEASWRMMRVAPVDVLPAVAPARDAGAAGGETSAASLRAARQSPAGDSRRTLSKGRGGDRVTMLFNLEPYACSKRSTERSKDHCACSGHCYTTGHSKRKPACTCQEPRAHRRGP